MDQMPNIPADRLPLSTRLAFDWVQSLPPVNALYYRLRSRLPDGIKAWLKAKLAGEYNYEGLVSTYNPKPCVDRELWHLQKVKHKLPNKKFAQQFGFTAPVSFEEGIRRTVRWLAFLGYVGSSAPSIQSDQRILGVARG
jgi:hypothetical protein